MSNSMSKIKHIVYLMLENRSFDNILGWLYDPANPPSDLNLVCSPSQKDVSFYGLEENKYSNVDTQGKSHFVTKVPDDAKKEIPNPDPREEYEYVSEQLFGARSPVTPADNTPATCGGFLTDYESQTQDSLQIMQAYTPNQLPILNSLAAEFAVSDYWFSSVPTQTNCNRAFSLAGTSLGQVNNRGILDDEKNDRFDTPSLFNVLFDNGFTSEFDWRIYSHGDAAPIGAEWTLVHELFPAIPEASQHITKDFNNFVNDASNGLLPKFSYLEPSWFFAYKGIGTNGNSYHPPAELGPGESLVKEVFDALTSTPAARKAFDETLLIITFDEHGGTYDHVPPPWGATPPWGTDEPKFPLEKDFKFNRFGVRVPTLLISPLIPRHTVFRSLTEVPYDHTSMIATVLQWFGIPKEKWGLGERVNNAPTFEGVLSLNEPRQDTPKLDLGELSLGEKHSDTTPISDLQKHLLPRVLRHMSGGQLTAAEIVKSSSSMLSGCQSLGELQRAIDNFRKGSQPSS